MWREMLIDNLEEITPEWLTAALGSDVTGADAALFGTGQFGLVARAELTGDAPMTSVIIKLPSQDETARALGVGIGAYEGEVRFYQELAPRSSIAVPAAFHTDFEPGTGRVTLVLEDLSRDWTVGDAMAGGTVEQ